MPNISRPLIGVTIGPEREGSVGLRLPSTYVRAIERAGGAPLLVPPVGEEALLAILNQLDGIVFPGGPDVDPAIYGANRHPKTTTISDLDRHELAVARWAVRSEVPVLGICRGQQLINVVLGGSLKQRLARHRKPIRHWGAFSHPLRIQPIHASHGCSRPPKRKSTASITRLSIALAWASKPWAGRQTVRLKLSRAPRASG
jgi:gamma-glutamyl-gamma-aminobutyrate hydrolase PuuD